MYCDVSVMTTILQSGYTAFLKAAEIGDLQIVDLLLEYGADIEDITNVRYYNCSVSNKNFLVIHVSRMNLMRSCLQ